MAIAIDDASGAEVWGIRYGYLSQEQRQPRRALGVRGRARSASGSPAACHLFAVGNRRPPGAVAACADGPRHRPASAS